MEKNIPKTYKSFLDGGFKSEQREYRENVPLLAEDGRLLSPGWARHMLFDYDSKLAVPRSRCKEWEFYQISNGRYSVQVNVAEIAVGGFVSTVLIDLLHPDKTKKQNAGVVVNSTVFYVGGSKYPLPAKCDVPGCVNYTVKGLGTAEFGVDTKKNGRTLHYKSTLKGKEVVSDFTMSIPDGHENMTTAIPFEGKPTRYFLTTKQNCMPAKGTFRFGDEVYEFSEEDSFCTLDWGRVNAPYSLVWYWGNGSTYITDAAGQKHTFGFELTWGIGDESIATETCLFYDGKVHKIGAVDVEVFPKPDKYNEPWHIISEDGRIDMTMKPYCEQHSDMNLLFMRMNCHQVHGYWSGTAVLDDGTRLEIKDMYAFCEYCENRW